MLMDLTLYFSWLPDFSALFSQIFVGISRSMILFMVAAGLTVVIGVLRIINFANSSFYMLGAFIAFTIVQVVGGLTGFLLAILFAPLVISLLGAVIESGMLRRIYNQPRILQLLLTYSLVLFFIDFTKIIWGVGYKSIPPPITGSVIFLGASLPSYNLIMLIAGPLVALGLWYFMSRTLTGKLCRATASDREMVDALGVNSKRVFNIVFALGCYLAGLGGALIAPTTNIVIGMGINLIINAVLVVVLGGLGNIAGAFFVCFIFGIGESLGLLFAPRYAIVFPYVIACILLFFRPTGLMRSVW